VSQALVYDLIWIIYAAVQVYGMFIKITCGD